MKNKGITLIALVITIIILLILAGVTIATLTGEGGILNKAITAKKENEEKTATEIINLKITNTQLQSYKDEEKMPDLQYLADRLYEDNEIQYIYNTSTENANVEKEKIVVTGNSIFTKLNNYPYEFEINSNLQLASINGIKVATGNQNTITLTPEELNELMDEAIEKKNRAVTVPTDGITYNTEYVDTSSVDTWVKMTRMGNVIELTFTLNLKKEIPNGNFMLISGIPNSVQDVRFLASKTQGDLSDWQTRIKILNSELYIFWAQTVQDINNNQCIEGSITYITNE